VIIHEIPGLHPGVVDFARRVIGAGFTAYLPSLFGTPGRPVSTGYVLGTIAKACVAKEFTVLATNRTSPVIDWLRALAAQAHGECGGPGVGAVGMCFTGGFALGMAVDERMLAPVLSQPSLPFPLGSDRAAAVGVSDADLSPVQGAYGWHLPARPPLHRGPGGAAARFATLKRELGDRFIAVEIDSSPNNPHGIPRNAHSVLTEHFVDEPGHPTHDALDRVLTLFRDRLLPSS
jgi:dienelactone hydrolase